MKDYGATSIASLQGKLSLDNNYSNEVYVICKSSLLLVTFFFFKSVDE